MFTGLVLGRGEITRRRPRGEEVELSVTAGFDWDSPLCLGESIAVSGVCLTVTGLPGPRAFTAYASAETLSRSTLGAAREINLERALALGDRLGGHLVSGHIDGTGRVLAANRAGASLVYRFGAGPDLMPFIVPKGSIAVDGVSLTVNDVEDAAFTVNLIPTTADLTTLGSLKAGDTVNLETDLLGKYVHRLMRFQEQGQARPHSGLTLDFLAKHGF